MESYLELLLLARNRESWLYYIPNDLIINIFKYITPNDFVNRENYDEYLTGDFSIYRTASEICQKEFDENIRDDFIKHYYETKEEMLARSLDKKNWRYQAFGAITNLSSTNNTESTICSLELAEFDCNKEKFNDENRYFRYETLFYILKGTPHVLLCSNCFKNRFDLYIKLSKHIIDSYSKNTWKYELLEERYIMQS